MHVIVDLNIHFVSQSNSSPNSSTAQDVSSGKKLFPRITQAAYDKGLAQIVEDELRSACVSAPKLIKAIRINEALGYLDTKNLNSKKLYDMLNVHFGLTFKPHTFAVYRSKIVTDFH